MCMAISGDSSPWIKCMGFSLPFFRKKYKSSWMRGNGQSLTLLLRPEISVLAGPKPGSVGGCRRSSGWRQHICVDVVLFSTEHTWNLGVTLGNGWCSVPRVVLISLHSPMASTSSSSPRCTPPHGMGMPFAGSQRCRICYWEVLQTTHTKYCQLSLVTGFYLLFWVSW